MNEQIKPNVWSLEKIRNIFGMGILIGGIFVSIMDVGYNSSIGIYVSAILMFFTQITALRSWRLGLLFFAIFIFSSLAAFYSYCFFIPANACQRVPFMTIWGVFFYAVLWLLLGLTGFLNFIPSAIRQKSLYNRIKNRVKQR